MDKKQLTTLYLTLVMFQKVSAECTHTENSAPGLNESGKLHVFQRTEQQRRKKQSTATRNK